MRCLKTLPLLLAGMLLAAPPASAKRLNLDRLADEDIRTVESILAKLDPVIEERKESGTLALLRFKDLLHPLDPSEKKFVRRILALKAKDVGSSLPFLGITDPPADMVAVPMEAVVDEGKLTVLPVRYLPREVYEQCLLMMNEIERETGRRVYIESGYRSPAYQLYLILQFLKKYDYSVRTTVRRAALPGYSEHGAPDMQAVDFAIETTTADAAAQLHFDSFPPYRWMTEKALHYGFFLSYPDKPGPGVGFESWHWHYDRRSRAGETVSGGETKDGFIRTSR